MSYWYEEADREICKLKERIAELEIHARVEIGTREMRIAELEAAVARLSARPTVAEHKDNVARIAELEDEAKAVGERIELTAKSAAASFDLLRGVVDAIHGPHPDPLTRWGVHDAPELAAALVAKLELVESARATENVELLKSTMKAGGLERALRDLVEFITDMGAAGALSLWHPDYTPANPWQPVYAENCPKCTSEPEECVLLCPLHKAIALLEGLAP